MTHSAAPDQTSLFRQAIQAQGFSRLLGTELIAVGDGQGELALDVRDDLLQQNGFVHGGVLSYLADNCLTLAGATALGVCLTSEFKINYLRPALGERLLARATVLGAGKRQAVCECKVFALSQKAGEPAAEKLVAVAQGTIVKTE